MNSMEVLGENNIMTQREDVTDEIPIAIDPNINPVNELEILTKNSGTSLVSDTSVLTSCPTSDVSTFVPKDKQQESRAVRALKSKITRLEVKSSKDKEQLTLSHVAALEKFSNETMTFRSDIATLEAKVLLLDQKIKCMRTTHRHAIDIEQQTTKTKLDSARAKLAVSNDSDTVSVVVFRFNLQTTHIFSNPFFYYISSFPFI